MRNISIYWKTVGISIVIMLITVGILFGLLGILAPSLTQSIQQEGFNARVEEIVEDIIKNGIDEEILNKYAEMGFVIITVNSNDIKAFDFSDIFDNNINANDMNAEGEVYVDEFESDFITLNVNNAFYAFREITHENMQYSLYIQKYSSFTVDDSHLLIRSIFPYFLTVGILVSIILSILYSRFFSNKIKHITHMTDQMKRKQYVIPKTFVQGDELQILENDISSLYQQLIEEI